MPCLLGCLALAFPRFVLFLVWALGGHYLSHAFAHHWLLPLLGFLFLPTTTLGFAYAMNSLASGGQLLPLGWLVVAIAAAIDVGLIGGGGRSARQWQHSRGRR